MGKWLMGADLGYSWPSTACRWGVRPTPGGDLVVRAVLPLTLMVMAEEENRRGRWGRSEVAAVMWKTHSMCCCCDAGDVSGAAARFRPMRCPSPWRRCADCRSLRHRLQPAPAEDPEPASPRGKTEVADAAPGDAASLVAASLRWLHTESRLEARTCGLILPPPPHLKRNIKRG